MKQLDTLPEREKKYLGKKEETLTCTDCQKSWTRISRRGRKPTLCPDCTIARDEAKQEERRNSLARIPQDTDDRMALARAGKQQRAEERAWEQEQEQEVRRQTIREQLPSIHAQWEKAFEIAQEENTDEAWRRCESLMTGYISAKQGLSAPALTVALPIRRVESVPTDEPTDYGFVEMAHDIQENT
jgi:hypothetical protein